MKKLLSTIIIAFICTYLSASPVSLQQARQTALRFYALNAPPSLSSCTVSGEKAFTYEGLTAYYAFTFKEGGWVIISADDAATPILGYSYDSPFSLSGLPAPLQSWLDTYADAIHQLVQSKASNASTLPEWKNILEGKVSKGSKSVSPFIKTNWDQKCYYNSKCPADAAGECGHVPTGCVATAFAQVLKYYSYPPHGVGTHTDTLSNYGNLTVDYGATTYKWGSMPAMLFSENAEVATLLYHCGIAVDMMYKPYSSGAGAEMIPDAIISLFDYSDKVGIHYLAEYSAADWKTLLKTELDAARPVIYSGADKTVGGHCMVMDGYDASDKFHLNLGWGGMLNGYFAIGALNTGNGNYNYINSAITNIMPNYTMSVSNPAPATAGFSLTPNPAKDICTVTLSIPGSGLAELSLYNLLGEKLPAVFDGMTFSGHQQAELNLSQLPEGVYFLRLTAGSLVKTQKLIISR